MEQSNKIILFQEKQIRRLWHNEQWYFSLVDIVGILTDTPDAPNYWRVLKSRLKKEGLETITICNGLKMQAPDGKMRLTDCANTEGVFRIIMSIPSPNAEPFKLWLAKVGSERVEEIQDPEIGFERLKQIYIAKGYPAEWVNARIKGIDIRKQLTEEWKKRGVQEGQEYSILTAEIAKATFGLSPSEHSKVKSLKKENLRDHMTNLELIFTSLGEELTRTFAVNDDAQGFNENHDAAQKGGRTAGFARERVEKETGEKIVSKKNFLKSGNDDAKELPNTSKDTE